MEDKIIKGSIIISDIRYFKDNFGILIVSPFEINSKTKPELDSLERFIIKGTTPKVEIGEKYNIVVKEVNDAKWGLQYDILFMGNSVQLTTKDEQKIFLKNILTEKQFETLYDELDDPFETIKNEDTKKLTQIKGMGLTTALKLIERYKNTIDYSDVYVKLNSLGLTEKMIKKLCDRYGSPDVLIEKFEENPYVLADEVDGVGFKRADELALKYGISKNSPYRIKAFVNHYLEEQAKNGNSFVALKGLVDTLFDTLGKDLEKQNIGQILLEMDNLWWHEEKQFIGLKKYYNLAHNIKQELIRVLNGKNEFEYNDWQQVVKDLEKRQGFDFTDQQKDGIKTVLENQLIVVTGFGGTGKSTIVKGMLEVLSDYNFKQTALAGRAASRLFEITAEEGFTIHRLLGYTPQTGWFYDKDNQLSDDIIILDETSMVDAVLFYKLIQAIKTGAKLIMLGDIGQLESIGIGNILHDLIKSGRIPTVNLTKIHRQAQKSAIKTESLKARKGEHIVDKGFVGNRLLGELKDLELDIYNNGDETLLKVVKHFKEKLDEVASILDIQIIAPMNDRGAASNFNINKAIQHIYNLHGKNEVEIFISKEKKYFLREGDKVINTKNNYKTLNLEGEETPIFNGSIGVIERINKQEGLMLIKFEGIGRVLVKKAEWINIQLGYSISVHKCQGSEFDVVILAIDYSSYVLLSRELLYTGITRAKRKCVLVGENKAIRFATSRSSITQKQTFLKTILKG